MGVKHIYARAIDKIHESILEGFNIDRIITPEQRAAADLTHEMELGTDVTSIKIDSQNYILKFKAPSFLIGTPYRDLSLEASFGLSLIAVTRLADKRNVIGVTHPEPALIDISGPDIKIEDGDELTVFGSQKSYRDLYRHYNPA